MRGSADVVVTVDSLTRPVPAGAFGGPTPDALAALIQMLSTLRDTKGNTTVRGLYSGQKWMGVDYPSAQLRRDASVLDPVALLGDGAVADMVWARPAVTVAGIDCPPVDGRSPRIQPTARAHVNLRVPPGMDPGKAQEALVNHLDSVVPWDVRVSYVRLPLASPFRAETDGPAFSALGEAMHEAYGKQMAMGGAGGSMASCTVFADAYPDAEIIVIGVQDPLSFAHAANESVDPGEVEHMALSEALLLHRFAMTDAP
jgi:acetylornithine deacetylase/succinyl-diaminopimelate desuccinylase-like protein